MTYLVVPSFFGFFFFLECLGVGPELLPSFDFSSGLRLSFTLKLNGIEGNEPAYRVSVSRREIGDGGFEKIKKTK